MAYPAFERPSPQVFAYHNCGDNPGSVNYLARLADELAENAKSDELVTLSDMFIDLGVKDPDNRDDYFSMAWENLNHAVDLANDAINGASEDDPCGLANEAVSARLRMSELKTWYRAAHKEPTTMDYTDYLSAAADSLAYLDHNDQVESTLAEFIPVLLGARSEYFGLESRWVGRLALRREDMRFKIGSYRNPNWDCAITQDTRAKLFMRPKRADRIQIKTLRMKDAGKYRAAGIKVMSSVKLGFNKVDLIIGECVAELQGETTESQTPFTDQAYANIAVAGLVGVSN